MKPRGRIWPIFMGFLFIGFSISLVSGQRVFSAEKTKSGPQKSEDNVSNKNQKDDGENGGGRWMQYGRDGRNTRFQPDETILNKTNITGVVEKWAYHSNAGILKGPAIDGNNIYFIDTPYLPFFGSSMVYKLDKAGHEIWKKDVGAVLAECGKNLDHPEAMYQVVQTPALTDTKIVFGTGPMSSPTAGVFPTVPSGFVVTMNKQTGACETATLVSDPARIFEGVFGSPTVFGHTVIQGTSSNEEEAASFINNCCTTIGKVSAVDINSGNILWNTAMIDADPSTPAYDSKANGYDVTGYSGVTAWGSAPAIYPEAGLVIVTTGNAYTRGVTPADQLSPMQMPIDAFVALDLKTGAKRWVASIVPDDYWNTTCVPFYGPPTDTCPDGAGPDYDFAMGCTLVKNLPNNTNLDADGNGQIDPKIDACIAVNKEGSAYAVEARTGAVLWKTKTGPDTITGLAGTCYDGHRLYATNVNAFQIDAAGNFSSREWTLQGHGSHAGEKVYGGLISALDPASGEILWQNADPLSFSPYLFGALAPNPYLAPPTCVGNADGFVLAASIVPNEFTVLIPNVPPAPTGPNMFAFDAQNGDLVESFPLSQNVPEAPATAGATVPGDGTIYWGDGLIDLPNFQTFAHRGGYLHAYSLP